MIGKIIVLVIVLSIELALYIKQCKNTDAAKLYNELVKDMLNDNDQGEHKDEV